MSIKVMQWVWENSPTTRGDRLVLLAIADCASDDGANAWPSLSTIAKKAGITVRACQLALRRLESFGYLKVEMQAGPKGCNKYTILMTRVKKVQGEGDSGAKKRRGEVSAVQGVKFPTQGGEVSDTKGVNSASPELSLEPSIEPSVKPSDARDFNRRVSALAEAWCAMQPLARLNKVKSVIAKALGAGWTDAQMRSAMDRLIIERYGMTEDCLRIALQPARAPTRPNKADQRFNENTDLVQRLAAQDKPNLRAIGGPS